MIDEDGAPVNGAELEVEWLSEGLSAVPAPHDDISLARARTKSTEDGRFRFDRIASSTASVLHIVASDFDAQDIRLSSVGSDALEIRLHKHRSAERVLTGCVLDQLDHGVTTATICFGDSKTLSMDTGAFRLNLPRGAGDGTPLVVTKDGFIPCVVPDYGTALKHVGDVPRPLILHLERGDLDIRGKVLESDGSGCRAWSLRLVNGTELEPGALPPRLAENAGKSITHTADDGSFRVMGLAHRDYTLMAWDPATLRSVQATSIHAGQHDVVLRAPSTSALITVRGRVVNRRGETLEDVDVYVHMVTAGRSETWEGSTWESGAHAVTDVLGRFVIEGVSPDGCMLGLTSKKIIPVRQMISRSAASGASDFVVAERRTLRLHLPTDTKDAAVMMLDASGEQLTMWIIHTNEWRTSQFMAIDGSESAPFAVSEDARTLVVFREGKEWKRQSIAWSGREMLEVQLGG